MALAGITRSVPSRSDPFRDVPQPRGEPVGRRNCRPLAAGCVTLKVRSFRSSRSTARISGVPVRWFPQSGLFMCPCHGGVYYADGARASGPPERGLFEYPYKIEAGNLLIKAGEIPTPGRVAARRCGEAVVRLMQGVGAWFDQRLQLGTPIRATLAHPVPRETASWFYVFGSAALTVLSCRSSPAFCSPSCMCRRRARHGTACRF